MFATPPAITSPQTDSVQKTSGQNCVSLKIISTTILLGASLGSWNLFSPSLGPLGRQQAEPAWSAATYTRTLSYSCLLDHLAGIVTRSRTVQVVSASGNIRPSALSFASEVDGPSCATYAARTTPGLHHTCTSSVRSSGLESTERCWASVSVPVAVSNPNPRIIDLACLASVSDKIAFGSSDRSRQRTRFKKMAFLSSPGSKP